MSAFIVGEIHIDALVCLAIERPAGFAVQPGTFSAVHFDFHDNRGDGPLLLERADELGQMLLDANFRSIEARYPEDAEDYLPYTYTRPPRQLTALEGLSALACYEYQSSECKTWEGSLARMFCEALRRHLVRFIPGYSDGPWNIASDFYRKGKRP